MLTSLHFTGNVYTINTIVYFCEGREQSLNVGKTTAKKSTAPSGTITSTDVKCRNKTEYISNSVTDIVFTYIYLTYFVIQLFI